eukprot:scaffold1178_cov252-Pinguiococcus_pyrenoidosus.AAC.27
MLIAGADCGCCSVSSHQVGAERRNWEQNKALVFDTCFQHSTGNESEEDRLVLIIDFWHPELSPVERNALQMIYDVRNKYDGKLVRATENDKGKDAPASTGGFFDAVKNIFGG